MSTDPIHNFSHTCTQCAISRLALYGKPQSGSWASRWSRCILIGPWELEYWVEPALWVPPPPPLDGYVTLGGDNCCFLALPTDHDNILQDSLQHYFDNLLVILMWLPWWWYYPGSHFPSLQQPNILQRPILFLKFCINKFKLCSAPDFFEISLGKGLFATIEYTEWSGWLCISIFEPIPLVVTVYYRLFYEKYICSSLFLSYNK